MGSEAPYIFFAGWFLLIAALQAMENRLADRFSPSYFGSTLPIFSIQLPIDLSRAQQLLAAGLETRMMEGMLLYRCANRIGGVGVEPCLGRITPLPGGVHVSIRIPWFHATYIWGVPIAGGLMFGALAGLRLAGICAIFVIASLLLFGCLHRRRLRRLLDA